MPKINLNKQLALILKSPRTAQNIILDKVFYKNSPSPFPRLINIFTTEACNFNCPMCHVKSSRVKNMSQILFKDLKRIIDESIQYSPSFQLTGGEPLMHPHIFKIIKYISDRKMISGLVTNGLLLEKYAQDIIDSGLDFLAISLDGPDENTQYQRGYVKYSFGHIIKGIKKIIKLRKGHMPNIRLATVISKFNLSNFDQIYNLAIKLKVDQWSLSHHFFYNKNIKTKQLQFSKKFKMGTDVWGEYIGNKKEFFTKEERQNLKSKLNTLNRQIIKSRKIKSNIISPSTIKPYYTDTYPSQQSSCISPLRQIFIRGNGDVEMCQGYILGNIKKNRLKSIWVNSRAQHFRKIFRSHPIMPACFRCCALNIKFNK